MSLIDVSGGNPRVITPTETASNLYVQAHRRNNPGASGQRVYGLINKGIDALTTQRIVYTRAGIMWGHDSQRPHKDVEDLWDSILKIVGGGKDAPIMLGCLFRHEMSKRPEQHWLCMTTKTDKIDPITLKKISHTAYWLDLKYTILRSQKTRGFSPEDLKDKWACR